MGRWRARFRLSLKAPCCWFFRANSCNPGLGLALLASRRDCSEVRSQKTGNRGVRGRWFEELTTGSRKALSSGRCLPLTAGYRLRGSDGLRVLVAGGGVASAVEVHGDHAEQWRADGGDLQAGVRALDDAVGFEFAE